MPKDKQTEQQQIKLMSIGQYTRKLNFEVIKTPYELSKLAEAKPEVYFNCCN